LNLDCFRSNEPGFAAFSNEVDAGSFKKTRLKVKVPVLIESEPKRLGSLPVTLPATYSRFFDAVDWDGGSAAVLVDLVLISAPCACDQGRIRGSRNNLVNKK
jgi:hypothetical protein